MCLRAGESLAHTPDSAYSQNMVIEELRGSGKKPQVLKLQGPTKSSPAMWEAMLPGKHPRTALLKFLAYPFLLSKLALLGSRTQFSKSVKPWGHLGMQ